MVCPICRRSAELIPLAQLEAGIEAVAQVARDHLQDPAWSRGICRRCVVDYERARTELPEELQLTEGARRPILPTPLRLGATTAYTGRGVTMALLDSGFYPHPDLVQPRNRIRLYHDVTGGRGGKRALARADVSSWHGMMTSTVAAGNGHLSGGLYRGLASDADLVLIKVGTVQRIKPERIQAGIEWVLRQLKTTPVQILNISCGGDGEASYLTDPLCQAVEEAVRQGIVVICAVGNLGHLQHHPVVPPANAPAAITVGGLDDKNWVDHQLYTLYRHSYGPTCDGLQKPEILAPSIWLAAPILPGTPTAEQARLLVRLRGAPPESWPALLRRHKGVDPELDAVRDQDPHVIGQLLTLKIRGGNIINAAYKHVDGTSFAAPIVSSLVAQMLEARPELTPMQIKRLLIETAVRLPNLAPERQGWGLIQPAAAVAAAADLGPAAALG
ncbi:MAG TPA: S8 family serine peptidase [Acidobacteriota bacterium]